MNNENRKMNIRRGPGGHGIHHVEKAKDRKGTIKKLLKSLAHYKIAVIIAIIFAIGSTVFNVIGPKILGNATTEIYNGLVNKVNNVGGIDFYKIGIIILSVLGLYVISSLFNIIQGLIMTNVSQKLTYKMRNDLTEKINKLPMKYFDGKTHGEVLSIITNDIDTLNIGLNQSITQIITSICTIFGILIMMLSISLEMTIVSLLILPITGFILKFIIGKSQKHFKRQQEYLGHVNGQVEEVYGGHIIVKAFGREEEAINEFKEKNNELYKSGWRAQFLSGLMYPLMNFVSNLGYVVVAILGGYLVIKNKIQVGNIQSFIQYNRQFTQPIGQIAQLSASIQSMIAAAERIYIFLEETEEASDLKRTKSTRNIEGDVEFKNVNFGYDESKTIINDFNCKIKKGQKIAIVGPTGAGKTTIVKLLMRFYDVNSGEILLDGHNIKEFKRGELRKIFGMVLQDTWLFSGTVKDNIKYSNPDATDSQVIEAAKAANIHHYIKTLPKSYEALINEEQTNISAGQKQLLTIARVILADPKVLILDEATSSIDTRTEQKIQDAMDNLMKNRTSFIIAHRLSTIKNSDLILVMDHGDIVEHGKHEELLKKEGFYAKLYDSQFDVEED